MEYVDKIFKEEQITRVQFQLKIPKTVINSVISEYIRYLRTMLDSGKSVKFLNICYLRVSGSEDTSCETLAYIGSEVAKITGVSPVVAKAVLAAYEEVITDNLSENQGVTVRGLVRIKFSGGRVRTKKSTAYNGYDVYVTTLPSFKRKVECTP